MTITRRHRHLAALGISLFVFGIYLITLAPSMSFIDAGELSAVAHTFGIAHPTGYPLFTIVAGLWAFLPVGDAIYRMNVLSAVLCAAAAGVMFHVIWFLTGVRRVTKLKSASDKSRRQAKGSPAIKGEFSHAQRLTASVFGALVIAFSRTFWSTALAIEVYPLHLLMLSLVLWLFTTAMFDQELQGRAWQRRWLLFAFVLGLSFTNHMTTVLLAPALLYSSNYQAGFQPGRAGGTDERPVCLLCECHPMTR